MISDLTKYLLENLLIFEGGTAWMYDDFNFY